MLLLYTFFYLADFALGEKAMMKEIFARGPIVCSIAATSDFDNNYPSWTAKNEGVFVEMEDLPEDKVWMTRGTQVEYVKET